MLKELMDFCPGYAKCTGIVDFITGKIIPLDKCVEHGLMTQEKYENTVRLNAVKRYPERASYEEYCSQKLYHNLCGVLLDADYLRYEYDTRKSFNPYGDEVDVEKLIENIDNMDSTISKGEIPAIILYKTCYVELEFPGIRDAVVGQMFTQSIYAMATALEESAIDFMKFDEKMEIIEIQLGKWKGNGIFLDHKPEWETEYGVLLQRGLAFVLVSTPNKEKNRYVFRIV